MYKPATSNQPDSPMSTSPTVKKAPVKKAPAKKAPATKKASAKKAPVPKKVPAAKKQPAATKKAAAPAPVALPPAVSETRPKAKDKLVRDSFAMPRSDFELIALLKERALSFRRPTKKSELLRAGLRALAALNTEQLQTVLDKLPLLKTARPKKMPPAEKAVGVE